MFKIKSVVEKQRKGLSGSISMAIKSGVFLLGAFGNGYSKQGKILLPMRLHRIVLFLIK